MIVSSPSSGLRLPHASAGPFWCAPSVEPAHEWHEIEALLSGPASGKRSASAAGRGLRSFSIVAVALVLGGGIIATTLIETRTDCGAACRAATADASAAAKPTPSVVRTAVLAPASSSRVVEGRSAAEPAANAMAADAPSSAVTAPVLADPMAPPLPHKRHHRHHH